MAILKPWYEARGQEITEGRIKMARIPAGAELILNPVSAAPGFRLGNVFVMAGIPAVMRGMLQDVGHRIEGGAVVHSHTVTGAGLREGEIAEPLGALAKARPDVSFGSYPWMRLRGKTMEFGVSLVARSRDADMLASSVSALVEIVRAQGVEPEIDAPEKK
jgi:molybdopterin-biosynthesis enzyme MoeA-like protein